jgi:hypothetical protein
MTDRQNRFLEALGLDTPWTWSGEGDCIESKDCIIFDDSCGYFEEEGKRKIYGNFIQKSPALFFALFDRNYIGCKSCKHMGKYNICCNGCRGYDEIIIVEGAVDKPWKKIVEIWEGTA